MKVTMIASITGTRDGQDWPAAGEDIDLPADEANALEAMLDDDDLVVSYSSF